MEAGEWRHGGAVRQLFFEYPPERYCFWRFWAHKRDGGDLFWVLIYRFVRANLLVKFCRAFSKARAGSGRVAPYTPFLFDNFFFAAPSCKEKVAMELELAKRLYVAA